MPDAAPPAVTPEFLTKQQAASFCGFSNTRTLDLLAKRARDNGIAPLPKIKLSRKSTLYNRVALTDWLNSFRLRGEPQPVKRGPGRPRRSPISRGSRNRKVSQ